MNKTKIISLFFALLIFSFGCDKDFDKINTDTNNPTAVSSGLLLADVLRNSGNTLYDTFVGGDMGACWSQQWSKVQYNDEERYIPRGSIISYVWDNFYEDVAGDADIMYNLAVTEENTNMQGVALVMKSYAFLVLTDCYGDIPFSEAFKTADGIFSPTYDSQESIYAGVLAMLDQANGLFSATGGEINASSDLLYSGDYSKWKKFANSLKFRALMRISGVKDVSAELKALVSAGGMFTSNSDEAKMTYLGSDPNANPIFETINYGARGEFKVSNVLVDMLVATNDPRLSVYVAPNAEGSYRGKPAGIFDVPSEEYNYNNVSPIGDKYLTAEEPAYYMSYAELQFLMAEAVHKGYITGTAQAFYDAGIAASMAANGITDWSMLVTTLGSDPFEDICNQKWLALYCQGVEAWTEQRRTGFPVLTPAIEGVISSIPARYSYPSTEQSLNKEGYDAAIARQGADLLTTKMWWNK